MITPNEVRDREDFYAKDIDNFVASVNFAPLPVQSLRERRIERVCRAAIQLCYGRVEPLGWLGWLFGFKVGHCLDCGATWEALGSPAHVPGCVIATTLRYAQEILATPSSTGSPQTTDERSAAAAAEPTDDRGRTDGDPSGTRTLFVNAEGVAAAWEEAQRGDRPRTKVLAPAPDLGEPYAYDRERCAVVDRQGLVVADLLHTDLEVGTHEAVGTRLARAVNFCAQLGPELRIEDYLGSEVRA